MGCCDFRLLLLEVVVFYFNDLFLLFLDICKNPLFGFAYALLVGGKTLTRAKKTKRV